MNIPEKNKNQLDGLIDTKASLLQQKDYYQAMIDSYLISKADLEIHKYLYSEEEFSDAIFDIDEEIQRYQNYLLGLKDELDLIAKYEQLLGCSFEESQAKQEVAELRKQLSQSPVFEFTKKINMLAQLAMEMEQQPKPPITTPSQPATIPEPPPPDNRQLELETKINDLFKEFGTYTPKLKDIAPRHLEINVQTAYRKFNAGKLPFPAFRFEPDNKQSPVLVNLIDLAEYLLKLNRQ